MLLFSILEQYWDCFYLLMCLNNAVNIKETLGLNQTQGLFELSQLPYHCQFILWFNQLLINTNMMLQTSESRNSFENL